MVIEELLQFLIGEVNTQLFKAIVLWKFIFLPINQHTGNGNGNEKNKFLWVNLNIRFGVYPYFRIEYGYGGVWFGDITQRKLFNDETVQENGT